MCLSESSNSSIGGYFELELSINKFLLYPEAVKFQSARAAFLALLRTGCPHRVWMPRFICDVMLAPLKIANVECKFYDLTDSLDVADDVELSNGDWLLYVNYFGLCSINVSKLLKRFSVNQIVLDFSQAFFEPPPNVLATIYSPRKFFGLPDGGLLVSNFCIRSSEIKDVDSLTRASHLLRRLAEEPENGYEDYQLAEKSLADCIPKQMSKLTERILSSIDFDSVSKKRLDNFMYLHERLGVNNLMNIDLKNIAFAPLCYPFRTHDVLLKKRLIDNRIFIPTYWTDAVSRLSDEWSWLMIWNCLPIPIDQRYGLKEMERIVSIIQTEDR